MRRGVVAILVALGLLAPFCWPYRLDTIAAVVAKNDTGCKIDVINNSGWKSRSIFGGIDVEEVAYPLQANVFLEGCPRVPNGRPYAAELISVATGKVISRGLACANAPEETYPCRLEMPPVIAPEEEGRYIVRIRRSSDAPSRDAGLGLRTAREWRSVLLDTIGSA